MWVRGEGALRLAHLPACPLAQATYGRRARGRRVGGSPPCHDRLASSSSSSNESLAPPPFTLCRSCPDVLFSRSGPSRRSIPRWSDGADLVPLALHSYIGGGADAPASNVFASFWRSEITNPEKAAGNIKYVGLHATATAELLRRMARVGHEGPGRSTGSSSMAQQQWPVPPARVLPADKSS